VEVSSKTRPKLIFLGRCKCIVDDAEFGASVEREIAPSERCEKYCEKRSREFARIPVEQYGITGEQKANIFRLASLIRNRPSPSDRHKLRMRTWGLVRIKQRVVRNRHGSYQGIASAMPSIRPANAPSGAAPPKLTYRPRPQNIQTGSKVVYGL